MPSIKSYSPKTVTDLDEQRRIAGNSLENYVHASEIFVAQSYLHLDTMLRLFCESDKTIRVLDLGSGNGVNSRLILRALRSTGFKGKLEFTLCDYFAENIEAGLNQCLEQLPDEVFRGVQIDFTDQVALERFIRDESQGFDLIFSVKFLHNVPIKINRQLSKTIERLLKPGSYFVFQGYLEPRLRRKVKLIAKWLLHRKFGNTIGIEIWTAKFWLRLRAIKPIREIILKASTDELRLNHFRHSVHEVYFRKR